MENTFQYRGDLAQTALPEILYTIDRFQVPGMIEATREGVVKQVVVKEGNVVQATSTDREDSLGAYLLQSGALSAEVYAETMREREQSNKRYGVLLIERGVLPPAEIYRAIRSQIESVVWSLFYWQDGSIVFSIGDYQKPDSVRIQLPMRQVILQGIRRAPDAKTLVARLGRKDTVLEPCFKIEQLIELGLDADEYRLLNMVDGKRTLYEVCVQGPRGAAENGKMLYAFHILQLIRGAMSSGAASSAGAATTAAGAASGATGKVEIAKAHEPSSGAIKIRFKTQGDRY